MATRRYVEKKVSALLEELARQAAATGTGYLVLTEDIGYALDTAQHILEHPEDNDDHYNYWARYSKYTH